MMLDKSKRSKTSRVIPGDTEMGEGVGIGAYLYFVIILCYATPPRVIPRTEYKNCNV